MRTLLLLFFAATVGYAQGPAVTSVPTVTSVTYDSLSHGSIRIDFQTSASWNYGYVSALDKTLNPSKDCTDGVSGVPEPNYYSGGSSEEYGSYQMSVGGLTAGHTYQFCPMVSLTNSNYTTGGASVTVTMPALPAIHPVPPIAPTAVPVAYPSDIGSYTTLTLGTNPCTSGFGACLVTAMNNQCSNGTILQIPAGVSAASIGAIGPWGGEGYFPTACDTVSFGSTNVSSSSTLATASGCGSETTYNSICIPAHGLSEGAQLIFGASYGCLPGDQTSTGSGFPYCWGGGTDGNNPDPFQRMVPYLVHKIDANVFQLYTCPGTNTNGSNQSCSFGSGTLMTFADQGNGTLRYAPWPRAMHWIIVRTSTPDSQFVPPGSLLQGKPDGTGVPTKPTQWASLMGNMQIPVNSGSTMLTIGNSNTDPMSGNIMFVGIHASYTDTTEPTVSGDPVEGGEFFNTDRGTSTIYFDRGWIDTPSTPFRTASLWEWNGLQTAIVNSYLGITTLWHQTISGLGFSGSGSTASIASGITYAGRPFTLGSTANVALSGVGISGGNHRIFAYFDLNGNLEIAAPAGVAATVSGVSNYHVTNLNQSGIGTSYGPGAFNQGTGGLTFPTIHEADWYYIDPIVSTTSGCSSTSSLFSAYNAATQVPNASIGNSFDLSLTITNDTSQYLCGWRWYKEAAETASTHTFALWNTGGTLLTSVVSSGETASGWQTTLLGTPYLLSASTSYVHGYHVAAAAATGHLFFQNGDYYSSTMHVSGAYIDSNGNGSYGDMWPQDYLGRSRVVLLGYIDINSSGTITDANNAAVGDGGGMAGSSIFPLSGLGPGPFNLSQNFLGCAGTPCTHFDDSGGRWAMRGDYTINRNYFYGPPNTFYGEPSSDGMDYVWRQSLEWKGGQRQQIYGNIFDGSEFEAGSHSMIALQSPQEVPCMTDSDIMWNTFKHGPGAISGGLEYGNGYVREPMGCPPVRLRMNQNVAWDMGPYRATGGDDLGQFYGGGSLEDLMMEHNTVFSSGAVPYFFGVSAWHQEGALIDSNFFVVDGNGGMGFDATSLYPSEPCAGLTGEAVANCKLTPNYVLTDNVLMPINGETQSGVESLFPSPLVNYFPSSGLPSAQGFFNAANAYSLTGPDPDLHLKSTSAYCSGCGSPAMDARDVGADQDSVWAQQGKVTLISANATGVGTASVTFDQPDAGTCTLDYGTESTVTTFTRITQSCKPGPVTFNLTGLSAATEYFFRYDGAVVTPMGQFRTR